MTEIKFRVFCEKHNRVEYYSLGDFICGATTTANGEGGIFKSETWEQFTGLHDKNGKEIYVGDKIKFHQFLFDGNEHEETGTGMIGVGEYGWMLTNIIHDGMSDYMGYTKQDQLDGKVETYFIDLYGLHEESFEVIEPENVVI